MVDGQCLSLKKVTDRHTTEIDDLLGKIGEINSQFAALPTPFVTQSDLTLIKNRVDYVEQMISGIRKAFSDLQGNLSDKEAGGVGGG